MKHITNFEDFAINESAATDNKENARKVEGEILNAYSKARSYLQHDLDEDQKEEIGKEMEKIIDLLDKASDEMAKIRKKIYSQDGLLWRK